MSESSYQPVTTAVETAWLSGKEHDHRLAKLRVKSLSRQRVAGALAAFVLFLAAAAVIAEFTFGVYLLTSAIAGLV